jgi:cytochrome c5
VLNSNLIVIQKLKGITPMLRDHPFLPLMALSFALALAGCSKKEEAAPPASAAPAEAPATAETAAEPAVAAPAETPPAAEPAPAAATETAPPAVAAPAVAAETGTAPPPAAEPATADTAAAPAKPIDGEGIAKGICMACHQSGMNGAPKFANKIAWAPRIAQGRETLYQHSINGFRGMPARGGNPNLTDDEVKAAVDYLVKVAGGYQE